MYGFLSIQEDFGVNEFSSQLQLYHRLLHNEKGNFLMFTVSRIQLNELQEIFLLNQTKD